jgi:hypothetical protein
MKQYLPPIQLFAPHWPLLPIAKSMEINKSKTWIKTEDIELFLNFEKNILSYFLKERINKQKNKHR